MSKNLLPDEVCHRIFTYLAGKHGGLTKVDQAELRARVLGHSDAAAQARYDKRAGHFFVLLLAFEDMTSDGRVELQESLRLMSLQEADELALARILAQQEAALRGRPVVVCDGNYENVEVFDEQNPPEHAGFSILQVQGGVLDSDITELDDDLEAQCAQRGASSTQLRGAIASAKACMEELLETTTPDETVSHLVLVAENGTRKVIWRLHR